MILSEQKRQSFAIVTSLDARTGILGRQIAREHPRVITWTHPFSPAKMWIDGLTRLNEPLAHLRTQLEPRLPNGSSFKLGR